MEKPNPRTIIKKKKEKKLKLEKGDERIIKEYGGKEVWKIRKEIQKGKETQDERIRRE